MTSGGPGPRSGGFLLGGATPSERTGDSGLGCRAVWAGHSWAARPGGEAPCARVGDTSLGPLRVGTSCRRARPREHPPAGQRPGQEGGVPAWRRKEAGSSGGCGGLSAQRSHVGGRRPDYERRDRFAPSPRAAAVVCHPGVTRSREAEPAGRPRRRRGRLSPCAVPRVTVRF